MPRNTAAPPIEIRARIAPMSQGDGDRALADLLDEMLRLRRKVEGAGHRFLDGGGKPLPPLEHGEHA